MIFYTPEQLSRTRRVIGLMSGTSVDGIDAAAVEIEGIGDAVQSHLAAFLTIPFDPALREAVLNACRLNAGTSASLAILHAALGLAFADAATEVRGLAGWRRGDVDVIGSHGQTVWHQPNPVEVAGAFVTGTMQMGDPGTIAERTEAPVVSDFRARDMAAGGQGAPLVPLVDWLLYRLPDRNRAIQNIGGIGNVAYLRAGMAVEQVLAFDTGPGNMVIDAAAFLLTGGAKRFDEDGKMAGAGTVHEPTLQRLLGHPFLLQEPPKSTGREVFGQAYSREVVDQMGAEGLSSADIMATVTALTVESIARSYETWLSTPPDEVVVCGGGARNPVLMRMLQDRMKVPVRTMEDLGENGDAKEAVAFAILADRTMQGLPGNVPRATGANRSLVLGSVTPGRK